MILPRLAPRPLQCLRWASTPFRPPPMRWARLAIPVQRRLLSTQDLPPSGPTDVPGWQPPPTPPPTGPADTAAAITPDASTDPSPDTTPNFWQQQLEGKGPLSTGIGHGGETPPTSPGQPTPSPPRRLPSTQARVVPLSPSYFSRSPFFNDHLVLIDSLLTKYDHLPLVPADKMAKVAWKGRESFAQDGEHVRASQYAIAIRIAKRLNQIHPSIMPEEVRDALAPFKKDVDPNVARIKVIPVDKLGRAVGVGRRKRAVARAWVIEGTGEVLINGKSLAEAFARVHDRESAIWALRVTERMDKYNVYALVEGGGPTGQAEAMAMAVAMGMMGHEPDLKPTLRRAGCVTRDPREVERKKAGRLKARKRPAWNAR